MVLVCFFEEGKHGGVAANPVFQTRGDTEGGGAPVDWDTSTDIGGREGCSRGVLPADESEDKMLCGIGSPEVVNISMMKSKCWGAETEEKRPKKRRKCRRSVA